MLESVLAIPFWIELAGCLTGGIAGGVAASRARYDVFGTAVIACVTGLGGGILRDILLQDFGIYAFQHPILIVATVGAGIVVFFFHKLADVFDWLVDFLDNLSVGLWAVVSVGKGLSAGLDIVPSVILGTITAVGGGIMRDVLMAKPPTAFQAGTLYGTASLVGSTAFALMKQNDLLGDYAAITCVMLVLALRYISEIFGWHTHPAQDYSDAVMRPVKKIAQAAVAPMKKAVNPMMNALQIPTEEEQRADVTAQDSRMSKTAHLRLARRIDKHTSAASEVAGNVAAAVTGNTDKNSAEDTPCEGEGKGKAKSENKGQDKESA